MHVNELKFWTMIVHKIFDRSKVICEWCSFAKLLWYKFTLKRHENNLGDFKEGVWRLWSANTLSRLSYKSLRCNHIFNTIQNIIWYTYIYIELMYSINFRNTQDINTYARSILFNLNPNPNLNPRNPRKEIKWFFETNHLWNPRRHWVLPWKMMDDLSQITIEKLNKSNF
jgi:hypothetical protein